MTKFKIYFKTLIIAVISFMALSCSNNDEIKVDPNATFDAVLEVKEAGPSNPNVDVVNVDANTSSTINAKVTFISTTKDMKRLYITQNIAGKGETLFVPTESVDKKADKSIDLTGKDSKNFSYQFKLPIPAGVGTTGTVVYKFWTTTGNGDFRDISQRLAVGPGTITLKFGTGTNPSTDTAPIKSYTDVKLTAPLADGTSKTFVSLLDGQTYNVSQGLEYVSLWDFGYLYATTEKATLRATFNYNVPYYPGTLSSAIIDITKLAQTTEDELNKFYFKKSTKTVADFDAIKVSSDLNFVTVVANNDNLRITGLVADNVVEFIDQYGKKGLIKVLQVNGTNGADGFIRIAIKVQP